MQYVLWYTVLMEEVIKIINIFSQAGTIVIALGVLASAICFAFKKMRDMASAWIQKSVGVEQINSRIDQVSGRMDKVSSRMDQVSSRIDQLGNRIDQTNGALISLIEVLKRSKSINTPEFNVAMDVIVPKNVQMRSPMVLTDEGLEKLQDSGLEGIIDKKKEHLFKDLEEMGVDSKFDIQTNSFYVMADYLKDNKEVLDKMKEYAFHKGIYNLKEFIQVGGIYLRDQYLKEKKIPIDEKKPVSEKA